jgi:hypothetical protein
MSIIHGSRGLIYFVHQFEPRFIEASLLEDPETLAGVTRINAEVQSLASVINAPEAGKAVEVTTQDEVPVASMFRESMGTNYLFAVSMRNRKTEAEFSSPALAGARRVEVLHENRSVGVTDRAFIDEFPPYAVRLYRWAAER